MLHFANNEKILIMLRRHWIILYVKIVAIIILTAIPFIFYPFIRGLLPWLTEYPRQNIVFLAAIIYYMFLWLYFFKIWIDYYLDVWIITNQRIMDIEQNGLFSREMSEFSVHRVQDVTVEVTGVIATLFQYGDVHIQTAGEARQFIFKDVPNPYKVKDVILKLQYETPNMEHIIHNT